MPVHHIHMDPVRPGGFHGFDFFGQFGEIGREDGGGDQHFTVSAHWAGRSSVKMSFTKTRTRAEGEGRSGKRRSSLEPGSGWPFQISLGFEPSTSTKRNFFPSSPCGTSNLNLGKAPAASGTASAFILE